MIEIYHKTKNPELRKKICLALGVFPPHVSVNGMTRGVEDTEKNRELIDKLVNRNYIELRNIE